MKIGELRVATYLHSESGALMDHHFGSKANSQEPGKRAGIETVGGQ